MSEPPEPELSMPEPVSPPDMPELLSMPPEPPVLPEDMSPPDEEPLSMPPPAAPAPALAATSFSPPRLYSFCSDLLRKS